MRSQETVGCVVMFWCMVALAGCGGSSGNESSTEATTTSAAKVTSFGVDDLRCGAAVTAPVEVTWSTEGATGVGIAVDDFSPAKAGPSGTMTITVPCDDNSHQITITPLGESGIGEAETHNISS